MARSAVSFALIAASLLGPAAAPTPACGGTVLERAAASRLRGLATKRLRQVRFENATLDEVVAWLRVATGWNFVVRRHVIAQAGIDPDALRVHLDLDDVTVATVLEVLLGPRGLSALVEGNVVYVTTRADALGPPVFAMYPISHLTWQKTDFPGPDLDLHPSDFRPPEQPEEVPVEDDPFLDPQHVVDLVREMVPGEWDAPGWTLRATSQWLFVRAPRAVQRRVLEAVGRMEALK